MEYCYHVLAGALDHYFDMLEKIKKQVHCDTGPTFAYFLGTIIENYHLSNVIIIFISLCNQTIGIC